MRILQQFEQSRFWERLESFPKDNDFHGDKQAVWELIASVSNVASQSEFILDQVCRFLPQYTLHNKRHILNVLAIMDELTPKEVLASMAPLECALCILAAYTHDLGMALSQEEHHSLLDESTEQGRHFASYRTRFEEELRHQERWQKRLDDLASKDDDKSKQEAAQSKIRIRAIEGYILASYLRDTHTEDDQVRRLRLWLDAIKQETGNNKLFHYGNFDFQRTLALIGISHGCDASWLRRQLIDDGQDDRFFQPVATGESGNLAFPGLLLRLADVMDFDASRAPRILFKHFGIENEQSILEWNKHLSIVGWRLDVDPDGKKQPDLLYSAECEHPVHDKAIREFTTWIDAELSAVRTELDAQRRQLPTGDRHRYDLHLPSQTRLDIRPARDPQTDLPKYVFHDLQFRLDQDEIQHLLMGESLYGDPSLCIRELLQNALDALQLREQRLKMKHLGEPTEPVDGSWNPEKPGFVREGGTDVELKVTLDWGTDEETDQQWLRVTDNGVGMTQEVITKYFTQIGKSYYSSPEFKRERTAMKAAGEAVSPISIFGIGILSCFMIADRLCVRTRQGNANSIDRKALDITISGPGSLFWFRDGTRRRQGTEIKIYLKSQFKIEHDEPHFLSRLRGQFGYSGGSKADLRSKQIDPALIAASHAAWPRYPLQICTSKDDVIRVDRNLHVRQLFLIDKDAVIETCRRLPLQFKPELPPTWTTWEWVDDQETGSRVRLFFPTLSDADKTLPEDFAAIGAISRQDLLAAVVEPLLEQREAPQLFVRGMYVEDVKECIPNFPFAPNVGSRIWVDLCGEVAPRLTVDRRKAMLPPDDDGWREQVMELFGRIDRSLAEELRASHRSVRRNTMAGIDFENRASLQTSESINIDFDFLAMCQSVSSQADRRKAVESTYLRFLQSMEFVGAHNQNQKLDRDRALYETLTRFRFRFGHHRTLRGGTADDSRPRKAIYALARAGAQQNPQLLQDLERTLKRARADTIEIRYQRDRRASDDLRFDQRFIKKFCLEHCWESSLLQEVFNPELAKSWPPAELFTLRGQVGDSCLTGPCNIVWNLDSDAHADSFADPQGELPNELVQRGYDLTFPMTAVPMGQLRRECAEWRTDRWCRCLGIAPFLLPSLDDVWPKHAEFLQATFGASYIYCLLPRIELWSKRFSDWGGSDWNDDNNLSALWDLSGHLTGTPGQVLWARGTHDLNELDDLLKRGMPAKEFLESQEN